MLTAPVGTLDYAGMAEQAVQMLPRVDEQFDQPNYKAVDIHLTDFKRRVYPQYVHTRYMRAIDEALENLARYVETGGKEGISRLMIFMPPRHGKTLTASRLFPAWLLGRLPNVRLIMASYGSTLAKRNSRFVRNMIKSKRFRMVYPDLRLSDDTASAAEWDIADHEGGAIAAGVGGGVTGHGAKLIIIDDPVKNRAEAESPVKRLTVKEWYTNDLLTRLEEPGGAILLMNTRWHQDDLAGWLLSDEADQWTVISFPALAEEHDPLGRTEGEALWPERFDAANLATRRIKMGEYAFASLYQQRPKPRGGAVFDSVKVQVVDTPPECIHVVRFYDLAVTAKRTSDYSAGCKMGVTRDMKPVIFDVWRAQLTLPEVHEAIVQNAVLDGKGVPIRLEAEKAGIVEMDYMLRDPRLAGYAIDAKPPVGDKFVRAGPFASRVNAGHAVAVKGRYLQAYLDELSMFQAGADHDDQVDASSGAWDYVSNYRSSGGIHV